MGSVNIPANPSGPGHISVKLHLNITDVQSINNLLRQAASIALREPAVDTASQDVEQASNDRAPADQADYLPQEQVILPPSPTLRSAPGEEDANEGLTPGPLHALKVVKEQPPAAPVQLRDETCDPSASRFEPAASQNPWSKKVEHHDDSASGSSQVEFKRSPGDDLAGHGLESSGYEQYNGQRSQPRPAKNSAQAWPTAQQVQTQPQRANSTTYGAGNAPYARTGGKKQMASKGFVAPIQITRMGWGDPLPNAQDTWGDEEPRPQPLASAMPAAGRPSARRPPPPSPAFPPMPERQDQVPPWRSPGPGPARPAQPQPTMHWQRMWTTDALDHVGDEVRACLHVTKMPDLVDENGGAGWLITTSVGLLNLWTCTCIGSPGEPALHLVHALDTEFLTSDMQIDPNHRLLMAVGRDTKALTECVALHHLRLQPGVFRLKGRLNLPCGVTGRLARNPGPPKALQVQSVDSYKGTMSGCCAASHDRTIVVYPANVVPGEMAKQKAFWHAHDRTITVLHANRFCPTLLSGDDGGEIRIWSMIKKPTAPETKVRHERGITGLHSLSQHSFVSCSMDGRLCVWDINVGNRPVSILRSPDNKPILRMAVRDDGLVAFCTQNGLYVANVYHDSLIYTLAVTEEDEDPVGCLTWNAGSTGQTYLYASNFATISAYRASQY